MTPVARQELEVLLADVLTDPSTGFGYALGAIAFQQRIEITLSKAGQTFELWLRPGGDQTRCYKETARFKVGHYPDPPDQLGYAVIDAVCARIEQWERSLSTDAVTQLFDSLPGTRDAGAATLTFEWLAVRSGLKPACRNLARAEDVGQIVATARAHGLHAEVTDAGAFVAGFCTCGIENTTTILHIGRTEAAALAAATAERAMIESCGRGQRVTAGQVRALGAALGYPACCVEAFIPVRDLSNAEIRFHALRKTPGTAALLLNNTMVDERSLVSHCLCRYDCAPSVAYARALLREFANVAPEAAERLKRSLAGLMVVFRVGGALRLVARGVQAAGPYRFASVEVSGEGDHVAAWQAALGQADGLEVVADQVRVLRGEEETGRLEAPSDEVQIRLFA